MPLLKLKCFQYIEVHPKTLVQYNFLNQNYISFISTLILKHDQMDGWTRFGVAEKNETEGVT